MSEIIGVHHEGEEIQQAVITYIDNYYPKLEKIMLELTPSWRQWRYSGLMTDFFEPIANHYESKGDSCLKKD